MELAANSTDLKLKTAVKMKLNKQGQKIEHLAKESCLRSPLETSKKGEHKIIGFIVLSLFLVIGIAVNYVFLTADTGVENIVETKGTVKGYKTLYDVFHSDMYLERTSISMDGYSAIVEFYVQEDAHTFIDPQYFDYHPYEIGEPVNVQYDPENPENAKIIHDDFVSKILNYSPYILGGGFIVIALIGLYAMIFLPPGNDRHY